MKVRLGLLGALLALLGCSAAPPAARVAQPGALLPPRPDHYVSYPDPDPPGPELSAERARLEVEWPPVDPLTVLPGEPLRRVRLVGRVSTPRLPVVWVVRQAAWRPCPHAGERAVRLEVVPRGYGAPSLRRRTIR